MRIAESGRYALCSGGRYGGRDDHARKHSLFRRPVKVLEALEKLQTSQHDHASLRL